MQSMKVRVRHRDAELIQCISAKGLWQIMFEDDVIGHLLVYVDDVLITAPTEVIHDTMDYTRKAWGGGCKIVGVIPKDDAVSEYKVDSLVFCQLRSSPWKEA